MRKLLLALSLLALVGCTTSQAVYEDLNLVKDNIVIQKRITDMLLGSVKPQNDKQIEAIAIKTMEVEQRFDRMAATHNRLVMFFNAEREVGYIVNILNFMQDSSLKNLLGQAEEEVRNEEICNNVIVLDYDSLLCDDYRLSSTSAGY